MKSFTYCVALVLVVCLVYSEGFESTCGSLPAVVEVPVTILLRISPEPEQASFKELDAAGLIYKDFSKKLSQDAQRIECLNKGGDLYVPRNHQDVIDLLAIIPATRYVYLGGRDKKWLNGQGDSNIVYHANAVVGAHFLISGDPIMRLGALNGAANIVCHIGVHYGRRLGV